MKKQIDWRANLAYIFISNEQIEEPIVPEKEGMRWKFLSKVLPHPFYHFFQDGEKTPVEAFEIADNQDTCPFRNTEDTTTELCTYYLNHINHWRKNMGYKCHRCCVCAQYKLLQPNNTIELASDKMSSKYTIKMASGDLGVYTKSTDTDSPFDTDVLQWNEHIGRQVSRLFESKFEREYDPRKKIKDEDDTINFGFYTRVLQFIEDSIKIKPEDSMIYDIKYGFDTQIRNSITNDSESLFNFEKLRKVLSENNKKPTNNYNDKFLENYFKKSLKKKKGRYFFRSDFYSYLNQADKAMAKHAELNNSFSNFDDRFNFLVTIAICQFFLNHDYIKNYFINPGSAAQDDKDLYEKT